MKKYLIHIGIFLVGLLIGTSFASTKYIDNNDTMKFGDTGAPKNCRAIIATNINDVNNGEYSAEDALASIDRNCGEFGYSWSE